MKLSASCLSPLSPLHTGLPCPDLLFDEETTLQGGGQEGGGGGEGGEGGGGKAGGGESGHPAGTLRESRHKSSSFTRPPPP